MTCGRPPSHGALLFAVAATVAAALVGCGGDGNGKAKEDTRSRPAAEWGYEGAKGPARWGRLDPSYATCASGRRQSPVDLGPAQLGSVPPIDVHYRPAALELDNNGNSIEAAYPKGSFVSIDGHRYDLLRFHFHSPAEHTVSGRRAAMELHLVHSSAQGKLTVLGVHMVRGRTNPAIERLWSQLPAREGEKVKVRGEFDAADLLPPGSARFAYAGSLTTPPCTEGVTWFVLREPIELSRAQIARFRAIYDHTNRPVQPLHGRSLFVASGPGPVD